MDVSSDALQGGIEQVRSLQANLFSLPRRNDCQAPWIESMTLVVPVSYTHLTLPTN